MQLLHAVSEVISLRVCLIDVYVSRQTKEGEERWGRGETR